LEEDNQDAFKARYQALAAAARVGLGKGGLVDTGTPQA
jgi:hypothetical protein